MRSSVEVENVLLLDSDVSGICEGITIRKKIISRQKRNKKLSVLTWSYVLGSLAWHIHTSHRGYHPPS